MGKLACTLLLIIGLTACAKTSQDVVCTAYASTYGVQWPDGVIRKSTVSECDNGFYRVDSIEGGSFTSQDPVVNVVNAIGQYELVYFSQL